MATTADRIDPFSPLLGTLRGSGRQVPLTITVTNGADAGPAASRPFTFRVVRRGDFYGVGRRKLHDENEPLVVVFDASYAEQTDPKFEIEGQMTGGTYYLSTLRERALGSSLNLHGGVPAWTVDAAAMREVDAWLARL